MNVLMVYGGLSLGGVETFIVRLSNWLTERGDWVSLLLLGPGELDCQLRSDVRVLRLPEMAGILSKKTVNAYCPGLFEDQYDAVLSFDPLSLCMSVFAVRYVKGNPRFATGVYHPRIYFFEKPDPWHLRLARIVFDRYVGDRSKYFMNEAVRAKHEDYFGRTFGSSRIIPIPIDFERMAQTRRNPTRGRFVSVGRLTAFKSYNLYMIDVVEQLLARGYQVEWHVYGEGELAPVMLDRINGRGLGNRIVLHGAIDYTKLPEAFERAFGFIGMGTALLEAGAAGVPSVTAVDGEGAISYGFLPELPFGVVGERLKSQPTIGVADLLERLLLMSVGEYGVECDRTKEYCSAYSLSRMGPEFRHLLTQGSENCDGLRRVPGLWRIAFRAWWRIARARRRFDHLLVGAVKGLVPQPWRGRLREARRKRGARERLIAEGVNPGVVTDAEGRGRRSGPSAES